MDIGVLKGVEWQEMLGELATCKKLRFVVTVDHYKSGILFTDQLLDQFKFVCVQLDTFQDFNKESKWQPDTYTAKNDNQEQGLAFVFQSMTQNQKTIIAKIAEHQLGTGKGISTRELLNQCVESMLATTQLTLKEYLHEAKDHNIVKERLDNGIATLYMQYPEQLLQRIVDGDLNLNE